MTQFLGLLSCAFLLGIYASIRPRWNQAGPSLVDSFVFGVGLYFVGAGVVAWTTTTAHADRVLEMSLMALMSALAGAVVYAVCTASLYVRVQFPDLYNNRSFASLESPLIIGVAIFSTAAAIYFMYAVVSSPVLSRLLTIDNVVRYATLGFARNAITSGSAGYMAPGFVKQFRDILLPVALMAMVLLYERPFRMVRFWAVLTVTVAAMLVNGQRSSIVVLVLGLSMAIFFASWKRQRERRRPGIVQLGAIAAIVLAAWTLLTLALGRGGDEGSSIVDLPATAVSGLVDRAVITLPSENSRTYDIWSRIGPTDGRSWEVAFGTIFKTNNPNDAALSTLSNELSAYLGYGGVGDSPLGLPPDVWLAWGWVGLAIVPALYVLFIGILDLVLLSEQSAAFFAMKIYLFFVMPICITPYLFVLNGGLACVFLIAMLKIAATVRTALPQKRTVLPD